MGALDGITVLALEQAVAAPLATQRMADAGARVIKIERAEGETARHYDQSVHGSSAYFVWLNRGKESAVLNLKDGADRALFDAMLARADVLVQNLVPGAMDRLGLPDHVLARDFPRLISLAIRGYGSDTDYAEMRAYDMLVQAESGLCAVTGTPDEPSKVGVSAADIGTGQAAYAAVLEALLERQQTGRGRQIEIAMFDVMADWMAVPSLHYLHGGKQTGRFGLRHASIYPYRPFACRDGAVVIAVQENRGWAGFCTHVLQRPDVLERPEFATNGLRVENRAALDSIAEPIFADLNVADATARCQAAGVAWARYRSVAEAARHPALRQINAVLDTGEIVEVPRPAANTQDTTARDVPALGQHTAAIRAEFSSENGQDDS